MVSAAIRNYYAKILWHFIGAYNYGYAVEPNGQFHHETRGVDGVTYGCYGYIDSDDLLKVTHYVADSQGYRTLEHEKPVLVYPVNDNK